MCWDQDKANEGSGDRTGGGDGDGVGNGARWHWDGGGGASDGVSDGDTSAKDDGDDLMVAMVTHSCQMSSVLILLPAGSTHRSLSVTPLPRLALMANEGLSRSHARCLSSRSCALTADNHAQLSRASLRIRILDVNDNPPELATPYEAAVCEDAKPGQVPGQWRAGQWRFLGLAGTPSPQVQTGLGLPSSPCPILTLQLIQTISVVDRDEPQGGHRFYFRLVPEAPSNPHFSLLDIQGELPLNRQILG